MLLHPQMKQCPYYYCNKFEVKRLNSFVNMTKNITLKIQLKSCGTSGSQALMHAPEVLSHCTLGMLPLSMDDASYTDSLTVLCYCLYYLHLFHSFQLGSKCIGRPCVCHDLLQLCKTWLPTCRCSCWVYIYISL